jgi:hypothetical protein
MKRKLNSARYAAVAAALLLAGTANAQERLPAALTLISTPTLSFGMIGLGTTTTARLNAVNLVRTPPPLAIAQLPCKLELDLYDGQGKLIKQKSIANLGYGQADFIDLARSEVLTPGNHVEITALIKVGSNQPYFCNINATLEVLTALPARPARFWRVLARCQYPPQGSQ